MDHSAKTGAAALLVSVAVAAVAPAAWAADLGAPVATAAAASEISGVTVLGRRDESRTVTATKTDTALQDVPQSITVISQDFIAETAMQGMADLVRYTPGVTMGQGEGHRDAPTIRGNATTADFFVDGVRDDVQYFRDLYNAERVEVLKGSNAMIFGRGGGGGVINRVTKKAGFETDREVRLEAGSYDHYRATADLGGALTDQVAGRLNLLYQDSGSYRDHVELERWGVNPTATFNPSDRLTLRAGLEHFEDERSVDRGVPSYLGRPLATSRSTFFGAPDLSLAKVEVDSFSGTAEYRFSDSLTLRNHFVWAQYDKAYQNVFPGAVNAAGTQVQIQAYRDTTERENLFNQTDLVWETTTGGIGHVLLVGAEFGRQESTHQRQTGVFNNTTATSINAPLSAPTLFSPVVAFATRGSDAHVDVRADVAAVYVQDQIELIEQLQLVAGLRFDSFDLEVLNLRTGLATSRKDETVSPRAGLVFKPIEPLSLYLSYSKSFLPIAGDQFNSLSVSDSALEPEEFENFEAGLKWEVREGLFLTAAAYRLDRTNTKSPHPTLPGVTIQAGSQRTEGFELGVNGRLTEAWTIVGGYSYQDAEITSRTSSAAAGKRVALTPEHTFSLWNRYQVTPAVAVGLGVIHQDEMFAAVDNAVTLPSFTRVDAAVFWNVTDAVKLQLNVENLLDEDYFASAHNNNNITPGAPRLVRASVALRF